MSQIQSIEILTPKFIPQKEVINTNEIDVLIIENDEKSCPIQDKTDECNTCELNNVDAGMYGWKWGWLGALILWFIIFTVLWWLIFFSLKPSFVLQKDSNQVDTSKVLLYSVIVALILVIFIWLIKFVVYGSNSIDAGIYGWKWGWLGTLILWFIIFTVLWWLIFFSLKPSFVLQKDSNQVDSSKVLLYSVIMAIILVIFVWSIKVVMARRWF